MDWKDIASLVTGIGAPVLGGLIGGPQGAAIGKALADALGTAPEPDAIGRAITADPDRARSAVGAVEADWRQAFFDYAKTQAVETGQTMRAELVSGSPWQTGWRPLWGYVSALVWAAMGVAIVRAIFVGDVAIIREIEALTVFLGVAGAVTGVYVWKRSEEKKVAMTGDLPGTIADAVARSLQRRR